MLKMFAYLAGPTHDVPVFQYKWVKVQNFKNPELLKFKS